MQQYTAPQVLSSHPLLSCDVCSDTCVSICVGSIIYSVERIREQSLMCRSSLHFGEQSFQVINLTLTTKLASTKTNSQKTNPNTTKQAQVKKKTKSKVTDHSSPLRIARKSVHMTVHSCGTQHSINSSNIFRLQCLFYSPLVWGGK